MSRTEQQEEEQDDGAPAAPTSRARTASSRFDERRAKMERLRAEGIDPYPPVTLWATRTRIADVLAAHDPADARAGRAPRAALPHRRPADLAPRARQDGVPRPARPVRLDPGRRARGRRSAQETYDRILGLDIGDIVAVDGCVYVTQRGQLALAVAECTLLTKTLRPPPDKHHGLGDTGTRYRYRELDLIANEETRELFITRHKIVLAIREWLDERNFVEIETPALQSLAGGAGSRPFTTHHNALDRDLYLRISVELFLNRCIVGGMENVYDMGKVFRNEGISPKHRPEFTIIEFMCAYSDYNDVATVTEEMFRDVAQKALGRTMIKRNGEDDRPRQAVAAGDDARADPRALRPGLHGVHARAARRGARRADRPATPPGRRSWPTSTRRKSSRTINQPTHVFDFPLEPFPITKRHSVHPELGEHFDAVIGGIELVSGDTELNDPVDQWQRFVDQRKRRMIDDADVPHPNDEEYARAIEYGYSPTAGGGMGVDRLVMILTERDTLREVIPFPIVRELR